MNCFVKLGRSRRGGAKNECFWNKLDPVGHTTLETSMWKNFLFFSNPRRPPEVKGPKSAKFDPTNHISAQHLDPVHPIWTKFGR